MEKLIYIFFFFIVSSDRMKDLNLDQDRPGRIEGERGNFSLAPLKFPYPIYICS